MSESSKSVGKKTDKKGKKLTAQVEPEVSSFYLFYIYISMLHMLCGENFSATSDCNQQGVTSQRWGLYRGDVVAVPVTRHWSVRPTLTMARLPIRATSTDASFYPPVWREVNEWRRGEADVDDGRV